MYSVELSKIVQQFHLEELTPQISLEGRRVHSGQVNRPALQLTGYYAYFEHERIQLIGNVEYSYSMTMSREERRNVFTHLFERQIPCLILCHGVRPEEDSAVMEEAIRHQVPIFATDESTSLFTADLIQFLALELAPRTSLHGVMMDCFGEGVLIQGESGFGKSETALELVQRGHRLVSDDVVEVRRINDHELLAQGVDVIRNLLELRGVGIINVKELYGVQAVRMSKTIDMVIRLEHWSPDKQYDRMGLDTETVKILGNELSCYTVPLMAGRNVAMIIEAAALNHRQKKMGHNAAEELLERVNQSIELRKVERKRTDTESTDVKSTDMKSPDMKSGGGE